MTYVELHCHSSYSFLDGASLPEELAARAAELEYPALALTDHDGVYGSLEFAHAAKDLGVRPITGAEVTLDDGSHLTLLVEDRSGYRNLCRLLTDAHSRLRGEPSRTNATTIAPRLASSIAFRAAARVSSIVRRMPLMLEMSVASRSLMARMPVSGVRSS